MSLFVDTSVFFAAAYRPDHNNEAAKGVLGAGEDLVTTDHVLVETWLLLQRRAGAHVGERFFAHVRAGAARLEMVGLADLQRRGRSARRSPTRASRWWTVRASRSWSA